MHLYNDYFAARASGFGLFAWWRSLGGETACDIWARDDVRPMRAFLFDIARRKVQDALGLRPAPR